MATLTKTENKSANKDRHDFDKMVELIENNPCEVYWDQGDDLNDDMIKIYWKQRDSKYPAESVAMWLEDEISDWSDNWYEYAESHIRQLIKENEFDPTISQLSDLHSHICYDYDVSHFNEDVHCVFRMLSDDDCINSGFYMQQRGFDPKDSYIADTLSVLSINPRLFFKRATDPDIRFNLNVTGEESDWEDNGKDDSEGYVSADALRQEIANNTSASILTILADIPFFDLDKTEFTLPEGSRVGFFNSGEGGGSMFDAALNKPLTITVHKDSSQYPFWRLTPNCVLRYGIDAVYGGWLN
jgi:hypothetical protein